jgi:hypothetical protein
MSSDLGAGFIPSFHSVSLGEMLPLSAAADGAISGAAADPLKAHPAKKQATGSNQSR